MSCECTSPFNGLPLQESTCNAASAIMFMSIVNALIQNRCDISDACGRIKPALKPERKYDFIVIGAGGGGSVIASRLSENPEWKVLLIEAGNDEPVGSQVPSFAYDFLGPKAMTINYYTEPQKTACLENGASGCLWPRAKVLGGCSVVNGMTYMRGVPRDYDNWARMGNVGWNYSEIFPYFLVSENNRNLGAIASPRYHAEGGPLTVERFPDLHPITNDILEAASLAGYKTPTELNGEHMEGFAISQSMSRNGTRESIARAYLRPARFRSNLDIMLNCTATRILFSKWKQNTRAKNVQFVCTNGKTYRVGVHKEVILTAGTISSPQLLLLSGVGPKKDLDRVGIRQVKELPGVGRNLHNHVAFYVQFNLKNQRNDALLNWDTLKQYLSNRTGPLSYFGIAPLCGRFSSNQDEYSDWPDMQMYFNGFLANCSYTCGNPNTPADPTYPNETRRILLQPTVVRPKSRGYLTLKSKNPFDHPFIKANYLTEEYDVKALIDGIRVSVKIITQENMRKKYDVELVRGKYGNCSELYEFDSDDFWRCAIRYSTYPENHQVGSCKMGPESDKMAVVDPQLRVHGISNLRVADASVMPQVVAANIFATVVLIAEKAADFIKTTWS